MVDINFYQEYNHGMIESEFGNFSQDLVGDAIKYQRERARPGQTALQPKRAEVIGCDERFEEYLSPRRPWENGLVTLTGEGFIADDNGFGRRTVFLEDPVNVDGIPRYLEVKGYGRNGKELWPNLHPGGDLYFGTFIDSATREFDLPLKVRQAGITNVQLPVELLKYSEADFINFTMPQLAELLSNRLYDLYPQQDRIIAAARQLLPQEKRLGTAWLRSDRVRDRIGKKLAETTLATYLAGGKSGLRQMAQESGLENELAGLIDQRQAGYVIRAVRSPMRVGDLHDPRIVTDRNKIIARQIGNTVRRMLEFGFLHTTPNPGNWTTEGELVDFEDVAWLPRDTELITQNMSHHKKVDLESYLEFIFGEGTIGYLAADFQNGFMREETTTEVVVKTSSEILQRLL